MGKQNSTYQISTWTTGAGIAIGTDIDIGGVLMGAAATTVTVKTGATTLFAVSGGSLVFDAGVTGAVTGTSSGGSFSLLYRTRG